MGSSSIKISVTCPVPECKKTSQIEVPDYVFQKDTSIIKIQISQGLCCPDHSFLVFLNKKGKVMGNEIIDHEVKIEKHRSTEVSEYTLVDLISDIQSAATAYVLHALIHEYPIIFICETPLPKKKTQSVVNFLVGCVPQSRKNNVRVMFFTKEEFENAKVKEYLVIDYTHGVIINTPWKEMESRLDNHIINRALEIVDPSMQIVIIEDLIEQLDSQRDKLVEMINSVDVLYQEDIEQKLDNFLLPKEHVNHEIDYLKAMIEKSKLADVKKVGFRSYLKLRDSLW
jgi:hypothetical protein